LDVAVDELEGLKRSLYGVGANAWAMPTGYGDWTLADLGRHVAGVAWRQAEAFHRHRLGLADAPAQADVVVDAADIPRAIDTSVAHLRSALSSDLAESPPVPLPFASLPTGIAAQVIAIEYGVHRYDVQRALGRQAVLRPEVAGYILGQLPIFLLMIGADVPDGIGYRLRSDACDLAIARVDGEWQLVDPIGRSCDVEATDESLALFVMGRLSATDPSVRVTDLEFGDQFKQCFPGP
jgi:uncharacterized protein (TIGR03083 family)